MISDESQSKQNDTISQQHDEQVTITAGVFRAAIFDLDGVVTQTARLHARAWKEAFDTFLETHSQKTREPFRPFNVATDYPRYVDGKPRYQGVESFLASRGIALPWGDPDDPPGTNTITGLGNQKNEIYLDLLRQEGADVYETSIDLIRQLKMQGFRVGVVTSSKNGRTVLETTQLTPLFDVVVDGVDAERLNLRGKPHPDVFLLASEKLGELPEATLCFEDAASGIEACHRGGFGYIIGVDRHNQAEALKSHGAHRVISDLSRVAITESTNSLEHPEEF